MSSVFCILISISWWTSAMNKVLTTMQRVINSSTNGSKTMYDIHLKWKKYIYIWMYTYIIYLANEYSAQMVLKYLRELYVRPAAIPNTKNINSLVACFRHPLLKPRTFFFVSIHHANFSPSISPMFLAFGQWRDGRTDLSGPAIANHCRNSWGRWLVVATEWRSSSSFVDYII